jgi:hypothetical protein
MSELRPSSVGAGGRSASSAHEGIVVPALATYRFRCRGETLIARFAAGQA